MNSCYTNILETGTPYVACTISGKAVLDGRTVCCKVCKHMMLEYELQGRKNCPLCHSEIGIGQVIHAINEDEEEDE